MSIVSSNNIPVHLVLFTVILCSLDSLDTASLNASTSLKLYQGIPFRFIWLHCGLKLTVPRNTLDSDAPPLSISLETCHSSQYKLPEEAQLISGVYNVAFPQIFPQPLTVEIQHCADLDQLSSLTIVSTESLQSHSFQMLSGGILPNSSSYGSIQLCHSSAVALISKSSGRRCRALIYHCSRSPFEWLIRLAVVWDLDLYVQVRLLLYFSVYINKY